MIALIILLLFSISFVPENIGFNIAFELRALVFAVSATGLLCLIGLLDLWKNGLLGKRKIASLDVAYIAVTILTVISFVTKTQSINAFHYVFVQVGMVMLYFFVRTTKKNTSQRLEEQGSKNHPALWASLLKKEGNLQKKSPLPTPLGILGMFHFRNKGVLLSFVIVGIGFIVAIIGLVQFALGKPIISTFGRTSYLGCFLAMNTVIAFGLVLAQKLNIQYSTRNEQCQSGNEIPPALFKKGGLFALVAFRVIIGVTVLTKSRTALIALAVVLPIMLIKWKGGKVITPACAGCFAKIGTNDNF